MSVIIRVSVNSSAKNHICIKVYENKYVISVILNRLEDRYDVLDYSWPLLPKLTPQFDLKTWPTQLRRDIHFQEKIYRALGVNNVADIFALKVRNHADRFRNNPDFYDNSAANMPKISNYIQNLLGNLDEDTIEVIRKKITMTLPI